MMTPHVNHPIPSIAFAQMKQCRWMTSEWIWSSCLGCNTAQIRQGVMFRRNVSPLSSWLKCQPDKEPAEASGKLSLSCWSWRVNQVRNQQRLLQLAACLWLFLSSLTLWPWRWSHYVPPKCQTVSKLNWIITQNTYQYFLPIKLFPLQFSRNLKI
jgi:hypothetical protein